MDVRRNKEVFDLELGSLSTHNQTTEKSADLPFPLDIQHLIYIQFLHCYFNIPEFCFNNGVLLYRHMRSSTWVFAPVGLNDFPAADPIREWKSFLSFFFFYRNADCLQHRKCQVQEEESRFPTGRVIRNFALSRTSVVRWISSDDTCNCFGRMWE